VVAEAKELVQRVAAQCSRVIELAQRATQGAEKFFFGEEVTHPVLFMS
jgi:hypothetical protein